MRFGHRLVPGEGRPLSAPDPFFDDAACGLLQIASDGAILRANRTFCEWVGRSRETLERKKRLQELLTMGGRIFYQTHLLPLLRMQGSISEVKLEVGHPDGSNIPMIFNARRHEVGGADVTEMAVFVARDRDKYERELVLSRKRLQEAVAEANDRALLAEQMIGIVSHDLRNPMSTIQMATSLLQGTALTPLQQTTIGRIARSVARSNHLIADLLDFTQARLGRGLSVELAPGDLQQAVADVIDELTLAHAGRTLLHERSGDGDCVADGHRIAQAVGNLVSNACAYGAVSSPITVRTSIDGDVCTVDVHNDGDPIPADLQRRIFDPMARGRPDGRSPGTSVGLGLFIVREIAKAHRGTATVTSTADEGTTFRLVFPRAQAPSSSFATT